MPSNHQQKLLTWGGSLSQWMRSIMIQQGSLTENIYSLGWELTATFYCYLLRLSSSSLDEEPP